MHLQCEPGRVLVSDAMSLLVRVVSVKEYGRGFGSWVVVDGGLNLMPTAGPHEGHRVELVRQRSADTADAAPVSVMLGGPLCYEGDVFDYAARFPRIPRVGDLIVIHDSGAYTVSRSTNFIRPRAAVIAIGETASAPGQLSTAWKVGYALRRFRARVVDGRKLQTRVLDGNNLWFVQRVGEDARFTTDMTPAQLSFIDRDAGAKENG
jgi:hypothetical protein